MPTAKAPLNSLTLTVAHVDMDGLWGYRSYLGVL